MWLRRWASSLAGSNGEGLLSQAAKAKLEQLCDKIVGLRLQDKAHVLPVMKEWEQQEGQSLSKEAADFVMWKLLRWNRPSHAMEVADWMYYKRPFPLDHKDAIFRMEVSIRNGLFRRADRIFQNLSFQERTLEAYNTMLLMYSQRKMIGEAIFLYYNLRQSDLVPNNYTFNLLSCVYRRCGVYNKMFGLLNHMEDAGVKPDLCFLNNLITAKYMREGIRSAEQHFHHILTSTGELRASHVATYSMMADAYISSGMSKQAEECLEQIEQRMETNQFVKLRRTYNVLLSQYARLNNFEAVHRVWQKIEPKKCDDFISMIEAHGCAGRNVAAAEELFQEADRRGMVDAPRMFSPLFKVYAAAGQGQSADNLKKKMKQMNLEPDSSCYHYFVLAHVNSGDMQRALEALQTAQLAGKSDPRRKVYPGTLTAVLKALAERGDVDEAKRVFNSWKFSGLSYNITSYNDLLQVFVKAGEPLDPQQFLRGLKRGMKPNRDTMLLLSRLNTKSNTF